MDEQIIDTSLGRIKLGCHEGKLTELSFTKEAPTPSTNPLFHQVAKELKEYLEGERKEFTFPIHQQGTPFQEKVWQALRSIPYGQAISYEELAQRVGNNKAFRAVGSANGKNHLAIVVPCHRVIAKNGKIGGYSGPEGVKEKLLTLENIHFKKD